MTAGAIEQRGVRRHSLRFAGMLLAAALTLLVVREPAAPPAVTPAVSPILTAELLHRVTYEEGESRTESRQAEADHGLGVTREAARLGEQAGEALLRAGDPQFRGRLGYRAEWQSEFHAQPGAEYWYGVSYYLPSDWDQGENGNFFDDRIIFQFHEGTGSPAFSLHVNPDQSRFVVRRKRVGTGFEYLWSMPFVTGRWYDFAFQVKWAHTDAGSFRVFVDGRMVHSYEGRTLIDGSSAYTKWGIYGQPARLLFDEVRIAEGPRGLGVVSPR